MNETERGRGEGGREGGERVGEGGREGRWEGGRWRN